MSKIFTATVLKGDCSPYVHIVSRNVSATLEDGSLVVTRENHAPLVVRPGECFASGEEAALSAIEQLIRAKAEACRCFDDKIESVKKSYLQAQASAV